jgi:hypothetical protein
VSELRRFQNAQSNDKSYGRERLLRVHVNVHACGWVGYKRMGRQSFEQQKKLMRRKYLLADPRNVDRIKLGGWLPSKV